MRWVYSDGGREAAGYNGDTGDCVTRAIAIATSGQVDGEQEWAEHYQTVYDRINWHAKRERPRARGDRSQSRTGVRRRTYERYLMGELDWVWTPTMQIGSGCRVHLRRRELPSGLLVVSVSKHMVAVVDGVVFDTFDPRRDGTRCVYGYYQPADEVTP